MRVKVAATAKTGYIQRRIIKLTEDIQVQYDGTVRDTVGKIYQLSYGENGMDPVHTVKANGVQDVCNISRMVDKLNMKQELKVESQLKKKSGIKRVPTRRRKVKK